MKRAILCLLLCLLAATALADDYGTAVIEAGSGGKLHLRAEASSESDSRGLFFTGTRVECRTDPGKTWVKVKIGALGGYMKSSYLRRGKEGDRVRPRFWAGQVTAKNWANMRTGPSTEYQLAGRAYAGDRVTILGETAEHWYYVVADGDYGYVSKKLVSLEEASSGGQAAAKSDWREAYRAYVQANTMGDETFSLINVNGDDIPELAIITAAEAGGCQILTYGNGKIDVLQTNRRHFTYQERGNLLCNSDGLMGYYYDLVYRIRDGRWEQVADGSYSGDGPWDEQTGRYICDSYTWNGAPVTESTYMQALHRVYDESTAIEPYQIDNRSGILARLAR